MRKVLMTLALSVAVAIAVLAGAGAGSGADDQGADWLAAGTGTLAPPFQFGQPMLHVNAQSGFGGVNPRGHFWIRYANGGGEFGGPVLCLTVVGNLAWLTGQIETVKTPRPTFTVGNYVNIRLADNGSPGTFDLANFDAGNPLRPFPCPNTSGVADLPITQGNYVVHDQPVADLLGLSLLLAQFESEANDPYGG
jgi:hypothetical protein